MGGLARRKFWRADIVPAVRPETPLIFAFDVELVVTVNHVKEDEQVRLSQFEFGTQMSHVFLAIDDDFFNAVSLRRFSGRRIILLAHSGRISQCQCEHAGKVEDEQPGFYLFHRPPPDETLGQVVN